MKDNEICILDLPLMQRLRRVRQLGLAYLTYPSAQHTRFEHSIGAMQAATRMFDQLATSAGLLRDSRINRYRIAVRLAALLHDCGHSAFSHVGENIINSFGAVRKEFQALHRTLDATFQDPVRQAITQQAGGVRVQAGREIPPAAELMSVLLILSERMENFLTRFAITREDILLVASLVIGKPFGLTIGRKYYDFVKTLISSDLDADKVDYVARDAYFAGIPIAADVDRLISQLATIELSLSTRNAAFPETSEVASVLPSGVAAVEMFIMTRSYLFDRIYQHPKVRAAERLLERLIVSHLDGMMSGQSAMEGLGSVLYRQSGDDGCLELLSHSEAEWAARSVEAILERKLPRRALALSHRCAQGYDPGTGGSPATVKKAWSDTSDHLIQFPGEIEQEIKAIADETGTSFVIVDGPRKAPLKETPEIYVADQFKTDTLVTINQHFDAAQLSKAYEDVKKVAWVFTDAEDISRVTAASAVVLFTDYGFVPNDEALNKAKIRPASFFKALEKLRADGEEAGDAELVRTADRLARARDERLRVPEQSLIPSLPMGNDADARAAARYIAEQFEASGLTCWHIADVEAALPILRILLLHSLSAPVGRPRHQLSLVERDFQEEVIQYLLMRGPTDAFEVDREHIGERGRVDIVVRPDARARERVAVELKSEGTEFDEIVQARVAQPFHYSADPKYCRIAILYCRFKSDQAKRPVSFLKIRSAGDERAPLLVICLGQQVTTTTASGQKQI